MRHAALVVAVAAVGLAGCASTQESAGQPSSSTGSSTSGPSTSGSSGPGQIGLGARCPQDLPRTGLPTGDPSGAEPGRVVPQGSPGEVLVCRYDATGETFELAGDKKLPSGQGRAVVRDLADLPSAPRPAAVCQVAPDPTPYVLVMAMPDDAVHIVRADADRRAPMPGV